MYAALRLALEDSKPLRAPRQRDAPHFVSMIIPFEGFRRNCRDDLTASEIAEFRSACAADFTLAIGADELINYKNVDQGCDGACTFVALLNLVSLMGRSDLFLVKNARMRWRASWRSFGVEKFEDLADCLDLSASKGYLSPSASTTGLKYVPIRSAGQREMCFNVTFWVPEDVLTARYNVNSNVVRATPWVYQNAHFVESLIDAHQAVVINFAEHSRTCVGYNEESLLFCDNWTASYEEICDTGGSYNDHFKAALSVCSKWAAYSWMREVVYVDNGVGAAA
eukprot:CAMPEP_0118651384 /NCGR_PEP_ID=MMETSP0785-20121206/10758_1 /TAXON_ID=91992 /ORGANISM="Bolidomonas pacifica, Strain CCMP 1866" /LENGTH=280 /DNA_ID=CAMNT_0006543835 /DNA_START=184 /DNA_END=1023 /DNA_ORIENTATION=-